MVAALHPDSKKNIFQERQASAMIGIELLSRQKTPARSVEPRERIV